jgi:anti-anti-sigma factor
MRVPIPFTGVAEMITTATQQIQGKTLFTVIVDSIFSFESNREFSMAWQTIPEGITTIRIDLGKVETLDSSALGILLVMRKTLETRGVKRFILIHCNRQIHDILGICHFEDLFELDPPNLA